MSEIKLCEYSIVDSDSFMIRDVDHYLKNSHCIISKIFAQIKKTCFLLSMILSFKNFIKII